MVSGGDPHERRAPPSDLHRHTQLEAEVDQPHAVAAHKSRKPFLPHVHVNKWRHRGALEDLELGNPAQGLGPSTPSTVVAV